MRPTIIPCALRSLLAVVTAGCALSPVAQDITALERQIQTLESRIGYLEQTHPIDSTFAGSSATATWSDRSAALDGQEPQRDGAGAPGRAFTKAFRGGVNLVTGWVEIPKRIQETTERSGPWTGFTWGVLRGLGYGFIRTAGGAYELVTFPFPAPAEFRPIIDPPFVF